MPCVGKFHGIFELFEKDFAGLVDVTGLLHGYSILLQICRSDVGVIGIEVSQ
jgi:hypothetical protein